MTTVESKRCKGPCGEVKPLVDFLLTPAGGRTSKCGRCSNAQQYERRKQNRERKVYNRAYNRASARAIEWMKASFPGHFERFLEEEKSVADRELDKIGVDAHLMPGPRLSHETAIDRIAKVCTDCAGHHRGGHACAVCGSHPGQQARVIEVSQLTAGTARVSSSQVTVIKP